MRRTVLALTPLLLALLSSCSIDDAFESYCHAQLKPTSVQVQTDLVAPKLDHSLSRQEISELLTRGGTPVEGARAMGATTASLQQEVYAQMDTLGVHGLTCGKPQLEVKLRLVEPVVHIAREFPEGSCKYDTVRLHEMRHVQAYEDLLARTTARATARLNHAFPPQNLHRGVNREELQGQLDRYVQDDLAPWLSRELSASRQMQAAIDTEDEYLRLTLACQGH